MMHVHLRNIESANYWPAVKLELLLSRLLKLGMPLFSSSISGKVQRKSINNASAADFDTKNFYFTGAWKDIYLFWKTKNRIPVFYWAIFPNQVVVGFSPPTWYNYQKYKCVIFWFARFSSPFVLLFYYLFSFENNFIEKPYGPLN